MPKVLMGPGPLATTTAPGQMSAEDKIKLNNITDINDTSTDVYHNTVPYLFRQVADGADVSAVMTNAIIGGSYSLNQAIAPLDSQYIGYNSDLSTLSVTDNIATLTITTDSKDV